MMDEESIDQINFIQICFYQYLHTIEMGNTIRSYPLMGVIEAVPAVLLTNVKTLPFDGTTLIKKWNL